MMAKCSGVDLGCLTDSSYAAKLSQITTPPALRAAHSGRSLGDQALRRSINKLALCRSRDPLDLEKNGWAPR